MCWAERLAMLIVHLRLLLLPWRKEQTRWNNVWCLVIASKYETFVALRVFQHLLQTGRKISAEDNLHEVFERQFRESTGAKIVYLRAHSVCLLYDGMRRLLDRLKGLMACAMSLRELLCRCGNETDLLRVPFFQSRVKGGFLDHTNMCERCVIYVEPPKY